MDIQRSYYRIDADESFNTRYIAKRAENNKWLFYVKAYINHYTGNGFYTTSIQRIVPIAGADGSVSPINIHLILNQPIDREDDIRDVNVLNAVFSTVTNMKVTTFKLSPYPDTTYVDGIKIDCYDNVSLNTFLDGPVACVSSISPREREYRVREFSKITALEDPDLDVFDFIISLGASDFSKIIEQSYNYMLEDMRTVLHQEHWLIN